MILISFITAGHNWGQLHSILSILMLLVIIAIGIWWLLDGENRSHFTLSSGVYKMCHHCATSFVCICKCQEHVLGHNDFGGEKLTKTNTM